MKLIIKLFLTIFFFLTLSNPVFSKNMGQMYKMCKAYQSKGFQTKELSDVECLIFFRGIIAFSNAQCQKSKLLYGLWKKEPKSNTKTDYFYKSFVLKEFSTSADYSKTNSIITSFLNLSEKNPEIWDNPPTLLVDQWLHEKWPCNNIK